MFPSPRFLLLSSSLLTLAVPAQADGARYELGLVSTWQHASDERVRDEALASADLGITLPAGPGRFHLHLEASTSQRSGGVSLLLGEANADAGTALDARERGRLQLSEANYALPLGGGELTVGLVNVADPLDNSEVANDEAGQFIGAGLVNNPTIEFPDYTVGGYYHLPLDPSGSGFTVLLASTIGIADTGDAQYSSVFDLDNVGSGAFVAAEWQRVGERATVRLGGWGHTADHDRLDGTADDARNYGVYLSADTRLGDAALNLRLGLANAAVSPAARFAAVAAELPLGADLTLGAGLAYTAVSGDLSGDVGDTVQGELHLRWQAAPGLELTPALQYLRHSGFDASGSVYDPSLWVAGVRLSLSL